jgi:hypothetical protein
MEVLLAKEEEFSIKIAANYFHYVYDSEGKFTVRRTGRSFGGISKILRF